MAIGPVDPWILWAKTCHHPNLPYDTRTRDETTSKNEQKRNKSTRKSKQPSRDVAIPRYYIILYINIIL